MPRKPFKSTDLCPHGCNFEVEKPVPCKEPSAHDCTFSKLRSLGEWQQEAFMEHADGWCTLNSVQYEEYKTMEGKEGWAYFKKCVEENLPLENLYWIQRCKNFSVEFNEEQWIKIKRHIRELDNGWFHLTMYNEEEEDHVGPLRLSINTNDTFMYASSDSCCVPLDILDEVLAIPDDQWYKLIQIVSELESYPPLQEILDSMKKCDYIPQEFIDRMEPRRKEITKDMIKFHKNLKRKYWFKRLFSKFGYKKNDNK